MEISGNIYVRLFFLVEFSCSVGALLVGFGVWWYGTRGLAGPGKLGLVLRMLSLRCFCFALEVDADFLAVVEHRLIPAWVRRELSRLRAKGLASTWAPSSQEFFSCW